MLIWTGFNTQHSLSLFVRGSPMDNTVAYRLNNGEFMAQCQQIIDFVEDQIPSL